MNEILMMEYSNEYLELLQEYTELEITERLLERNKILSESTDPLLENVEWKPFNGKLDMPNMDNFKAKKEGFIAKLFEYLNKLIKKFMDFLHKTVAKIEDRRNRAEGANRFAILRMYNYAQQDNLRVLEKTIENLMDAMNKSKYIKYLTFDLDDEMKEGSYEKNIYDGLPAAHRKYALLINNILSNELYILPKEHPVLPIRDLFSIFAKLNNIRKNNFEKIYDSVSNIKKYDKINVLKDLKSLAGLNADIPVNFVKGEGMLKYIQDGKDYQKAAHFANILAFNMTLYVEVLMLYDTVYRKIGVAK